MPTLLIHPSESSVREVACEFPPGIFDPMDDDAFFDFCQRNDELQIERTPAGEIEIMPPTGWESGEANSELNYQLRAWSKKDGRGDVGDSSTGFYLDNRAERSPNPKTVSGTGSIEGFVLDLEEIF